MGVGLSAILIVIVTILLSSCSNGSFETVKDATPVDVPIVTKVTKGTYMNGEQFCAKFVNTDKSESFELGKWIDVPYDYSDSKKTVKIYTYTKKKFDPNLPSYILVDGGPGQNTHLLSDIIGSGINEIRFDQRGVGCSAPKTWEEYSDPGLYSSLNTARDIEEIRKAYGVSKLSVYGISYGTIPATIYANKFENETKALVIEGVVGRVENLARYTYNIEKYNLILSLFNSSQREAFDAIMYGDDRKKLQVIMYLLGTAGYYDGGFKKIRDEYFKKMFPESGGVDEAAFEKMFVKMMKENNPYDTPQFPGAVDENVLVRFYCKELGGFSKDKFTISYSKTRGFFEEVAKGKKKWASDCAEQGITMEMENTYDERSYPTHAPVYYFQGSHDGATVAEGALNHWKFVPQDKSYFLLSLKGGHNPAISKTKANDVEVSKVHKLLFSEALNSQPIDFEFIKKLNAPIESLNAKTDGTSSYTTWELYTSNKASFAEIEKEFSGLSRLSQSK